MSEAHAPDLLWPSIDVTLDGKTWSLKPTFDALMRIERARGVGLIALLYRFQLQQHGVTDVAQILYEGIRAEHGNDTPKLEAIGEAVVREGLTNCTPAALDLLTAAVDGLRRPAAVGEEEDDGDPTTPPGQDTASPGGSSSEAPSSSA